MKARLTVTLKTGVLDPQGKAIEGALAALGFSGVNGVRQGKVFDIDLAESDPAKAEADASGDGREAARQHGDRGLPRRAGLATARAPAFAAFARHKPARATATNPRTMRPLAFLIAFLLLAPAAHAKPPRVNGVAWIGGLALHFDANRWDVNGAESTPTTSIARHATASTRRLPSPSPTRPMPPARRRRLTFEDADPAFRHGRTDTFSHAGLTFLVAEGDFGCRNLAGGPVRACTTYAGKTYMFDAPGQQLSHPVPRRRAGKRDPAGPAPAMRTGLVVLAMLLAPPVAQARH